MKNLILFLSFGLMAISTISAQIPEKKSSAEGPKIIYVCPMHEEETSKSHGNCNICGIELIKTTEKEYIHTTKGSQAKMEKQIKYNCAQDGSTSDKPGACLKCGKDRTKIETEVLHEHQ